MAARQARTAAAQADPVIPAQARPVDAVFAA
jgi:hypothetical protein